MTCVATDYLDDSFAANAVHSDRKGNRVCVRYVGFADLRSGSAYRDAGSR